MAQRSGRFTLCGMMCISEQNFTNSFSDMVAFESRTDSHVSAPLGTSSIAKRKNSAWMHSRFSLKNASWTCARTHTHTCTHRQQRVGQGGRQTPGRTTSGWHKRSKKAVAESLTSFVSRLNAGMDENLSFSGSKC